MKRRPKVELQPPRKGSEGLRAAQHDAPPPRTFAGTQLPPIPGQMTLGES